MRGNREEWMRMAGEKGVGGGEGRGKGEGEGENRGKRWEKGEMRGMGIKG